MFKYVKYSLINIVELNLREWGRKLTPYKIDKNMSLFVRLIDKTLLVIGVMQINNCKCRYTNF